MNVTLSARRGRAAQVGGLCLMTAAAVVVPRIALAADATAPTIRATIGSDGAVKSVDQLTGSGRSGFSGTLPIAMKITHTSSGAAQTFTYQVQNTFTRTQTVTYQDTAGKAHQISVPLQLPLVAQLGVDVPKSMGAVDAGTGTVSVDSAGTRHVLYNLVLFSPIGSPTQDMTLTTAAGGTPVAELRATAVNPATTAGVSAASQNATKSYQQDDFWAGFADGANGGLGQLSAGLVKLFSGASQLHSGLAGSLSGTNQAATGSTQLYDGSTQLTGGLGQISGGLDQLAPGARKELAGLKQAKTGADQLLAGLGTDKKNNTVLNGVNQIAAGLKALDVAFAGDGTAANPGLTFGMNCAVDVVGLLANGNATATADPCFAGAFGGTKPALAPLASVLPAPAAIYGVILSGVLTQALVPINQGLGSQVAPGLHQLAAGSAALHKSLTGKFRPGLAQLDAGMKKLIGGMSLISGGIGQLAPGAGQALAGSKKVTGGLQQLSSGLTSGAKQFPAAVDGAGQVADGLKQVLDGVNQAKTQAVGPLAKQLKEASQNSHESIAVLTAAGALAAQAPGGSGASYVLSQAPASQTVSLAADSSPAASGGSSHTGRNIGIGLGGAALLLVGLGSGFAFGRRRTSVNA